MPANQTAPCIRRATLNGLCIRAICRQDFLLGRDQQVPHGIVEYILPLQPATTGIGASLLGYRVGTWACAIREELRAGNKRYFRHSALERVLYRNYGHGLSQRIDYCNARGRRWLFVRSTFIEKLDAHASFC